MSSFSPSDGSSGYQKQPLYQPQLPYAEGSSQGYVDQSFQQQQQYPANLQNSLAPQSISAQQGGYDVALLAQFRTPSATTLKIDPEGYFSGKRVHITGADGQSIIDCMGKGMFTEAREFHAPDGQLLFTLNRHAFSHDRMFTLDAPTGQTILRVNRFWSIGRPKLDVHFANAVPALKGQEVQLEIRYEGFLGKETSITWNGNEIANFYREGVFHKTWSIRVQAGVDLALMGVIGVILCLVFREEQERKSRH